MHPNPIHYVNWRSDKHVMIIYALSINLILIDFIHCKPAKWSKLF